jgi:hypothetical protein
VASRFAQQNGFGPSFFWRGFWGWHKAQQSLTPAIIDWLDGLIGPGGLLLVVLLLVVSYLLGSFVSVLWVRLEKVNTSEQNIQKPNKRTMAGTITEETKREGQRKVRRHAAAHRNQQRERANISRVGSYLTHGPSNVRCMQRSIPTLGSYLTHGPSNVRCMQRSIPTLGYRSTLAISTHLCQIIN